MAVFVAPDGVRLHYTDEGEGLPVLCLAGLTRSGTDFDYVAPHLTGLRLIRLDYRGRGLSEWADPATYTIPQEAQDAVALLDHLGIDKAAVLGTSRGGLIAMVLAATAKNRLLGVALNDIGPEIAPEGLEFIKHYIGRNPSQTDYDSVAAARAKAMEGVFADVPEGRWHSDAELFYRETDDGLVIRYDPRLRDAVLASGAQPAPDLWPLFDALDGLPLALIRGANSDLLSKATADEMSRRRPDMIRTDVPGRGHVPWLDEAPSLQVLNQWLEALR